MHIHKSNGFINIYDIEIATAFVMRLINEYTDFTQMVKGQPKHKMNARINCDFNQFLFVTGSFYYCYRRFGSGFFFLNHFVSFQTMECFLVVLAHVFMYFSSFFFDFSLLPFFSYFNVQFTLNFQGKHFTLKVLWTLDTAAVIQLKEKISTKQCRFLYCRPFNIQWL